MVRVSTLTQEQQENINSLLLEGMNAKQISKELNLDYQKTLKIVKKIRNNGKVKQTTIQINYIKTKQDLLRRITKILDMSIADLEKIDDLNIETKMPHKAELIRQSTKNYKLNAISRLLRESNEALKEPHASTLIQTNVNNVSIKDMCKVLEEGAIHYPLLEANDGTGSDGEINQDSQDAV